MATAIDLGESSNALDWDDFLDTLMEARTRSRLARVVAPSRRGPRRENLLLLLLSMEREEEAGDGKVWREEMEGRELAGEEKEEGKRPGKDRETEKRRRGREEKGFKMYYFPIIYKIFFYFLTYKNTKL